MTNSEIKEQLDRIEQYSMIAAKSMLNIKEAAFILGMSVEGVRMNVRKRIIPCYSQMRTDSTSKSVSWKTG